MSNLTSFYTTRLASLVTSNNASPIYTVTLPTVPTSITLAEVLNITNTTPSTTILTGAFVTSGGIGIGQSTYLGGTLTVTNTSTASVTTSGGLGISGNVSSLTQTNGGTINVLNTTAGTSTTAGALVSSGVTNVGGALYVGGSAYIGGIPAHFTSYNAGTDITLSTLAFSTTSTNQNITVSNTTPSTAIGTGALIITGNLINSSQVNSGSQINFSNLNVSGNITAIGITPGNLYTTLTGNVGIGKAPSAYPLDIGTSFSTAISTHGFLTSTTTGGNNTFGGSTAYSANFEGGVVCGGEIDVTSDVRNKENIISLEPSTSLQTLGNLRPVYFKWKDEISKGTKRVAGFIAQEVHAVFPLAIQKHSNFVADTYSTHTYIKENNKVKIDCADLQAGDEIKYYLKDNRERTAILDEDKVIHGKDFEDQGKVFVYGKKVNDFHTLDYTQLIPLLVSSNQALYQKYSTIKELIEKI